MLNFLDKTGGDMLLRILKVSIAMVLSLLMCKDGIFAFASNNSK